MTIATGIPVPQNPVADFEDFLKTYERPQKKEEPCTPANKMIFYYAELLDQAYATQSKELPIYIEDLNDYDKTLVEYLYRQPQRAIREFNDALRNRLLARGIRDYEIHVRLYTSKGYFETKFRELLEEKHDRLVYLKGVAVRITAPKPRLVMGSFECPQCANIMQELQMTKYFTQPKECSNPNCKWNKDFQIISADSEFIDHQVITIQEDQHEMEIGRIPRKFRVHVEGDLVERVRPGSHIKVMGVFRPEPPEEQRGKKLGTVFDTYIDANSLEFEIEDEEIQLTPADVAEIMALAKDPQIKQKIIQSIAPTIYGNEDVKLAVAFSLFGGVKNVRSYETTRGDIHTLLIGDPATGKSVILQQACTLIPRSIFTNGKGSSVAGLTAGFVAEKDKSLSLEVGAMVLASGGLAVIDEFDNMREGDRSAMHQVMEQQQYSLSKAGFQGTIATETTVIAAANPKLGRYSEYHTISENINLSPPLLSRFDLILVLRDKPDEARDRKIARQIFKKQGGGAQTGSSDPDLQDPPIPKDLLRKYIYHARKTCRPVLKEEAHALLEDFYVQLRKTGSDEKNAVSLCARQLSGLVRICQALAKMRLSNEATVEDAKDAKDYLSKMLKSLGYDEGTMNIDAIFCNVSPKVRQTTERVMKAFDDLIASNPPTTGVAVVDIYESLIASGSADIERSFIQDVFDRLLKEGKIALTGSGYRPIKG